MAWKHALQRMSGPTMLALSRQDLMPPPRDIHSFAGGYIRPDQKNRDITFIASGSEVEIALEAQQALRLEGIDAAVISLCCWELFLEMKPADRAAILGNGPRIGVEAAVQFGWDQFLAPDDIFVGMKSFGASAKAPELFEYFGITKKALITAAKNRLST